MEAKDLERFRRLFPITDEYVYMNHSAAGPFSTRVVQAVGDFLTHYAREGSVYMRESKAVCERTREKVASLIGATPDEVAFTKNTPDGLNFVANGLDWKPGDVVVTSDIEFPANVWPWLNLADRGVQVRFVESRNGCIDPQTIIDAIDDHTRLVTLSWVEFHGGYRNDLARIGAVCRSRGVFLAADAIQGVGVLQCDVNALGVDFLAFSSQKWLLAPHGVGIFYCRRDRFDDLRVAAVGQGSVVPHPNYPQQALSDNYELKLKPSAGRFEPGFVNQTGIAGLEAALDLFAEVGMSNVEDQILGLTRRLIEGLRPLGMEIFGSTKDHERAGIVAFRSPHMPAAEIVSALAAQRIVVCEREGFVRVTPHFYNTAHEIDRLLAAIPAPALAA